MPDPLEPLTILVDRLIDGLTGPQLERVMTDIGVEARADYRLAAIPATGADLKYSGWKKLGPLKMGFEHTGPGQITIGARPTRGWRVAESGRQSGNHGRTAGRHALTNALAEVERNTPRVVAEGMQRIFAEAGI